MKRMRKLNDVRRKCNKMLDKPWSCLSCIAKYSREAGVNKTIEKKRMSTVIYEPTHQPNAPDHISLPRLDGERAAQREEEEEFRHQHTQKLEEGKGGSRERERVFE